MVILQTLALATAVLGQTCPPPQPPRCPSPGPSCQARTQPPGSGPDPASVLRDLTGPAFDVAYMRAMFIHHSDIADLATQESRYSNDSVLRPLAEEIQGQQTDLNRKLALWYRQRTGQDLVALCYMPNPDLARDQGLASGQFDNTFAATMIDYLRQSRAASTLALTRAASPELKYQARIVIRACRPAD